MLNKGLSKACGLVWVMRSPNLISLKTANTSLTILLTQMELAILMILVYYY